MFVRLVRFSTFVVADKWSPALQIRTVLLSIQALLSAPNPDDPLDNQVAEQWKVNEPLAISTGNLLFFIAQVICFVVYGLRSSARMDEDVCNAG